MNSFLTALFSLIALSACTGNAPPKPSVSSTSPETTTAFVSVPKALAQACEAEFQDVCFCQIPHFDETLEPEISTSRKGQVTLGHYRLVDFSVGAPKATLASSQKPPNFLHIQLFVGELSEEGGLLTLTEDRSRVTDTNAIPKQRREVISFGSRTWGEHEGDLLLSPPYPVGGVEADHLLFHTRKDDTEYAVSLHAWIPLEESISTLKVTVESFSTNVSRC